MLVTLLGIADAGQEPPWAPCAGTAVLTSVGT